MKRLTAKDFPPELLELYDGYVHGRLSRRGFLDGAAKYAIGGLTASVLLAQLSPNYAQAQQVAPTDPDIEAKTISYSSPDGHGQVNGLLVKPTNLEGRIPAGVVVVHENRGLNPYIEDVARRLAKAGFVALAPDGLTSLGGYPGNDDEGRELQRQIDPAKLMNDFFAAIDYLRQDGTTTDKIGITGFCYGGGVCNAASIAYPELAAAVPFYGRQANPADVGKINAPLLFHFAETDPNVNATWPDYEAALQAAGKHYEAYIYPATNHGFHNDSTPRYDAQAAALAWKRTIDWFNTHLG